MCPTLEYFEGPSKTFKNPQCNVYQCTKVAALVMMMVARHCNNRSCKSGETRKTIWDQLRFVICTNFSLSHSLSLTSFCYWFDFFLAVVLFRLYFLFNIVSNLTAFSTVMTQLSSYLKLTYFHILVFKNTWCYFKSI